MKIASYNLWESPAGMPYRRRQTADEILACGADILCLQEVESRTVCETLAETCGYASVQYNERDGTAVFGRVPFVCSRNYGYASAAAAEVNGRTVQVFGVHLPWKSALERERAVTELVRRAEETDADYTLFAGDFNGSEQSSVHRFLTGEQSLLGTDAYFFDLAESYAAVTGTVPETTLLLYELNKAGYDLPLDALSVEECAQALRSFLEA